MRGFGGDFAALPPGSVVGILGGGQLGRMLALEAARLGLCCHIFAPPGDTPAALVSDAVMHADYDDEQALRAFAQAVDVVTYEFENVPAATAEHLSTLVPVRPSPAALLVCQDRLSEKAFLNDAGIPTAPFSAVDDREGLRAAIAEIGAPSILKTRRFGYDGKGQARIDRTGDAADAWRRIGESPAILEGFVPFSSELSVIVARAGSGECACYDPVTNVHENHILARSTVPAGVPVAIAEDARRLAERIAAQLEYVGVMGVEMFFEGGDNPRLYVNELAPRVHNSGHWTLDACLVSQFEQHMRAVCGWPLGTCVRHHDAVMENLLGDEVDAWATLSADAETAVHIYGKQDTRPGRKMGHVTRLLPHSGGVGGAS